MGNLFLLPTPNPSELYKNLGGELGYTKGYAIQNEGFNDNQNIYITSDEEIKFDEYYLGEDKNIYCLVTTVNFNGKKIILTTDLELINDGVQAIPDEFLEWFVENPTCTEVEVVSELKAFDKHGFCVGVATLDTDYTKLVYYIVPKEYSDSYNEEDDKLLTHIVNKYFDSKQETLEEAKIKHGKFCIENNIENPIFSFDKGAKWQEKRSFTEEDFKLFARQFYREIKLDKSNLLWEDLADKCLEEFKKTHHV